MTIDIIARGMASKAQKHTDDSIASAIRGVTSFNYRVVDSLPSTGEKGIIYLMVFDNDGDTVYDQYLYVDNQWRKIATGNTASNDFSILDARSYYEEENGLNDLHIKRTAIDIDSMKQSSGEVLINSDGVELSVTTADEDQTPDTKSCVALGKGTLTLHVCSLSADGTPETTFGKIVIDKNGVTITNLNS